MLTMGGGEMSDGLARVRARFVEELQERFRRVQELRLHLEQHPSSTEPLTGIGQIAHKIAGTAATLGFPELGSISAQVDDAVAARAGTPDEPDAALTARIDHMLAVMGAVLTAQPDQRSG